MRFLTGNVIYDICIFCGLFVILMLIIYLPKRFGAKSLTDGL